MCSTRLSREFRNLCFSFDFELYQSCFGKLNKLFILNLNKNRYLHDKNPRSIRKLRNYFILDSTQLKTKKTVEPGSSLGKDK